MKRLFLVATLMLSSVLVCSTAAQEAGTPPRTAEPRTAAPRPAPPDQRAAPRAPDSPRQKPSPDDNANRRRDGDHDRNRADQRRPAAPPRVLPPAYYGAPHRYFFPPVSLQRGFYYHPYFGFYYGPYYGPFYPYPGPFLAPARALSAIRTRVKPVETEVYVNGYFAGLVDDFDGVFQRLYVPSGQHEIAFRLDGHETFRQLLYLQPGDTRDVVHQMRPLHAGEVATPVDVPTAPAVAPAVPPPGDRPASPFGMLTLHVEPADGQVLIDGEIWVELKGRRELVMHVPAGTHQLEVRREGYQPFRTGIALSEGAQTTLKVTLQRQEP